MLSPILKPLFRQTLAPALNVAAVSDEFTEPVPALPTNTAVPTLSGTPVEGNTLSVYKGAWWGVPTPVMTVAWLQDGVVIDGQVGDTLLLTAAHATHLISCRVTGTNSQGVVSVTTAAVAITAVVVPEPVTKILGDDSLGGGSLSVSESDSVAVSFLLNDVADVTQLSAFFAVGGGNAKTMIYSDRGDGYPLNLVYETGLQAIPAVPGNDPYHWAVNDLQLQPGRYWAVTQASGYAVSVAMDELPYQTGTAPYTQYNRTATWPAAPAVFPETSLPAQDLRPNVFMTYTTTQEGEGPEEPALTAPANTAAPSISGTAVVGSTLTINKGTWTGNPTPTLSVAWLRDGVAINGQTGDTYLLVSADAEHAVSCQVTGTNSVSSTAVIAAAVNVPAEGGEEPGELEEKTIGESRKSVGSSISISESDQFGSSILLEEIAQFTRLEAKFTTGGGNCKLMIYSDNAGMPGERLYVSPPFAVPATPGDTAYGTAVDYTTLAPGRYWLIAIASGYSVNLGVYAHPYQTGPSPFSQRSRSSSYTNPLNPWSGTSYPAQDMTASILATYLAEAPTAAAPVNSVAPSFVGTVQAGQTVTVNPGVWDGFPTPSYSYAFTLDGTPVTGTGNALTLLNIHAGQDLVCTVTATNSEGTGTAVTAVVEVDAAPVIEPSNPLVYDLSYVDQGGSDFTAFMNYADNLTTGSSIDDTLEAVSAYLLTDDDSYRVIALALADAQVTAAEAAIAGNGIPVIANDSYLYIGPMLTPLAIVHEYCSPSVEQQARWKAYADQAIYNVWNYATAAWGGTPRTWSGWGSNDPGNNYFYSFCNATLHWALASRNSDMVNYLAGDRFVLLENYFADLAGGGSREGTGYGLSARDVFDFMQTWEDSGYTVPTAIKAHATNTVNFWAHATMPNRTLYQPIGDLARERPSYLMEYHREMMLRGGMLAGGAAALTAGYWANNAVYTPDYNRSWALLTALLPRTAGGSAPATLTYYSPGTGNLFSRTSWASDATFMHFIAGQYDQSHAHQEQGGFSLFKDNFLSVTGNYFSSSGITQGVNCHNVLRFQTGATVLAQGYGEAVLTHTPGSGGDLVATANLKPVYSQEAITSYTRAIDFTAGVLTVTDAFAVAAGTTATFQVCTTAVPSIDGNVITAGNLRVTVLSPASPSISFIAFAGNVAELTGGWRIDIAGSSTEYVVKLEPIT